MFFSMGLWPGGMLLRDKHCGYERWTNGSRRSIKQIENETNSDVRSLRIERFGWHRYIEESEAFIQDSRYNSIEGTREALYNTKNGRRLIATCPSGKGRIVSMGVPPEIDTCQQAQDWLAGEKSFRVLGRT